MSVSVTIHVDPASRISLAATLTRDDGSVLRDGTVFSQDEGDNSLTIDFSLPIDRRMTGKEDSIHISCIADANGQTYSYNQTVPWAIVHEESVSTTEPTCSSFGHTVLTCTICGYTRDFILPMDPARHDWGNWADNGNGTHSRTCRHDPSHIETLACDYSAVVIPPTCETPGLTTHICNTCWHAYDDTPTPAMDHDWGDWVSNKDGTHTRICKRDPSHKETENCSLVDTVVPPACREPGYTTHHCTVCAYDVTDQTVPPLLHDWSDWASNNDGTHTRVCKRDASHQETENCRIISQIVEPTCTEEGYTDYSCILCNYGYEDMIVPALGHQPGAWRRILEPTRYVTGKEEQRCVVCDTLLKEQVVPKLSGMRYSNTACVDGPRFRDSVPGITDKWYSYAVIDLGKEGTAEYPLIASNQYRIGTVFVTVSKAELTVRYQLCISKYVLREEFLTFFSSLENINTLDTEKLKTDALKFNQPMVLSEVPQEKGKTILFMRLLLNYDSFDKGISLR